MSRPTLLLAGGGHADIPMIHAARRLGFRVVTSGNNPATPGHAYADAYDPCDFSDPKALLAVADRQSISAVCPSCNDFSALSSAWVAHELGLPGHDLPAVSEIIHHKDRWRAFAAEHGIPSPAAVGCSHPEEAAAAASALKPPLLVKPVDLTGGKGIARIDRQDQAAAAIDGAFALSRAGRVVVERFLEGTRHGWTGMVVGGRVVFSAHDDEHYHTNPYLVAGASMPGSAPPSAIAQIGNMAERIAGILRIVDGIFHVQFIATAEGPVIIEICRRPPGDLYVELVRHSSGYDYPEAIVRAFAGLPIPVPAGPAACRPVTRHCVMADRPGPVVGMSPVPAPARLIDEMVLIPDGGMVRDHRVDKPRIRFLSHPDLEGMRLLAPRLHLLMPPIIGTEP